MAADPKYTVFIRVPIPRGDFVDPPPVDWDATKDESLWRILTGAAQTEINWNQVAADFDVDVDFLLKQVAYLTERHASQVRAQVKRATAAAKTSSATPSPTPGAEPSASGHQRTTSALSRRDSPMLRESGEGGSSAALLNRSSRPVASRNASTRTAHKDEGMASTTSPRPAKATPSRTAEQTGSRRLSMLSTSPVLGSTQQRAQDDARSSSPGPAEPSSESSSDDDMPTQSRIIRRPPKFQKSQAQDDEDDGEESEPAFQPYRPSASQPAAQDLASTLRDDGRAGSKQASRRGTENVHQSQTSDSSTGSGLPGKAHASRTSTGPLSPRRTAELSGKSPAGKGVSREGSDGTPSMGSSYSDLDDASVTQSALEEALASHMNRPGASRFSISQAFRSRHTTNPHK